MRPSPIQYLNTDLDLTSADDLRPLVRALERRGMYALHVGEEEGGWRASLEAVGKEWRTPAGHLRDILKAVDALSPRSRGAWDRCRTREANIGYGSGLRPRLGQFNQLIPHKLLARMVEVGLSIRTTIYPPDNDA